MSAIHLFLFAGLLVQVSSKLCNVTETVDIENGIYFSVENNNSCYIFGMNNVIAKQASNNCKRIGGYLTDMDTFTDDFIQKRIAEEAKNNKAFDRDYWIGLGFNIGFCEWYWISGAKFKLSLKLPRCKWRANFYTYEDCATVSSKKVISAYCGENKAFICKLNLEFTQEENNQSVCSRCHDYITKHRKSAEPVTISTTDLSSDSVTSPEFDQVTTTTTVTAPTSQEFDERCGSAKTISAIIFAVIGGISSILLLVVIVMSAMICRYRRLLNDKDKEARISLVDILKADNKQNGKERATEGPSSLPGSTSQLLQNDPDTYSCPHDTTAQTVDDCHNVYQNREQVLSAGHATPPVSPHVLNNFTSSEDQVGDSYSHLDQVEGKTKDDDNGDEDDDDNDDQNMYGINSSSSIRRGQQSATYVPESETYEPQSSVYEPQSPVYEPESAGYVPYSPVAGPHSPAYDSKSQTYESYM